jgi:hypothetical protein
METADSFDEARFRAVHQATRVAEWRALMSRCSSLRPARSQQW